MVRRLLIIKGARTCKYLLYATLMGLDMIHGPKVKNGSAALRQILDIQLFRLFPLIPDEFVHGTSSIGTFISLPIQGVQECLKWMSYTSWMSWTLDIEIVSAILIESDFSLTWDQFHWKFYLFLFPCTYRTSKFNFVCVL
jgi:hypothetical protein